MIYDEEERTLSEVSLSSQMQKNFKSEFHKINFFAFATKLKYIFSFAHKVFPFTLLICINDIYLYFFLFLLFLPYISAKINNYFVHMWCDVSLCFFFNHQTFNCLMAELLPLFFYVVVHTQIV